MLVTNDDLVYVADRSNNRLQVFKLDGSFVKEVFIAKNTLQSEGTVHAFATSPDKEQKLLYVVDGSNKAVRVLNRQTLEILTSIGGQPATMRANSFTFTVSPRIPKETFSLARSTTGSVTTSTRANDRPQIERITRIDPSNPRNPRLVGRQTCLRIFFSVRLIHMKRTNLVLDDTLLQEATRLSGERTYSAAVNRALEDFVKRAKARRILELAGSGLWIGDLTDMRHDRPKRRGKTTRVSR